MANRKRRNRPRRPTARPAPPRPNPLAEQFFATARQNLVEQRGDDWVEQHQGLLDAQEKYIRETFF